jgi:dCTP deaminase
MTILSSQTITKLNIIRPAVPRQAANGLSFGVGPAGYDVRIAETIWLWPFWGRLASTVEEFVMPENVLGEVKDKSTWARSFVFVQNTVIEPGWRGYLTLELTRLRPWPVRIKAGTPIAQVVFSYLDQPTTHPYRGKYQYQEPGAQPAIFSNKT